MQRYLTLGAGILFSGLVLAIAARATQSPASGSASGAPTSEVIAASAAGSTPSPVQRGEHLVLTSGCHDCHTPLKLGKNGPEPDMSRMLSGHPESFQVPPPPKLTGPWMSAATATNTAWSGPWGISHTANLTPDRETGLGEWTEENFVQTIRTGRHMGRGREILPPMPIPAYSNFTDEELRAIFAYLGTIPAIKNRVPAPVPPG